MNGGSSNGRSSRLLGRDKPGMEMNDGARFVVDVDVDVDDRLNEL